MEALLLPSVCRSNFRSLVCLQSNSSYLVGISNLYKNRLPSHGLINTFCSDTRVIVMFSIISCPFMVNCKAVFEFCQYVYPDVPQIRIYMKSVRPFCFTFLSDRFYGYPEVVKYWESYTTILQPKVLMLRSRIHGALPPSSLYTFVVGAYATLHLSYAAGIKYMLGAVCVELHSNLCLLFC